MKISWPQGEHVVIVAPTGAGKTTIASTIVGLRAYTIVFAVKRHDDTLELFKKQGYKTLTAWPPENQHQYPHVIFWAKPTSLTDGLGKQSQSIKKVMDDVYLAGGWCCYFDEVGYLAGTLGLGKGIGVMLNQGRSNHITVVATMTRPTSVIARIPKETLNQARHILIGKYINTDEQKACASVAGLDIKDMLYYQKELRYYPNENTDFLYINKQKLIIITP